MTILHCGKNKKSTNQSSLHYIKFDLFYFATYVFFI